MRHPTSQVPLFQPAHYRAGATISEQFEAFHEANPWVADALERLTDEWLLSGRKRIGVKALIEILRWETRRSTVGGGKWRLNNNYAPLYARLLIDRRPEFAGVFELRVRRAA